MFESFSQYLTSFPDKPKAWTKLVARCCHCLQHVLSVDSCTGSQSHRATEAKRHRATEPQSHRASEPCPAGAGDMLAILMARQF
ncbi:hypothetical protein RRG08_052130 [Elysia crispata]|uniref:Uncharacterized protein n=1 Tax=Elysia crispata TaxID=231223 RepID=A0AAE1A479_9GAST|nr:hypothetical protein RRG08_052130 [Elysia crispata]